MAVEVARPPSGATPAPSTSWWQRLVAFYHGVVAELRKVTWPDKGQVRQATIAIIIFVLVLALCITILDYILSSLLVRLIPSLFAGR